MIKSLVRTLAFMSNWTAMVIRQPTILFWMIAGPFVVLLLFGLGGITAQPPSKTIVVNQASAADNPYNVSPQDLSAYLTVVEVTDDLNHALYELQAQRVTLVLLLPSDPVQTIQNGQQAIIKVFANEIDPVRIAFIQIDLRGQMNIVNNTVAERAIDNTKSQLGQVGSDLTTHQAELIAAGVNPNDINKATDSINTVQKLPAQVIVSPFDAQIQNIAPVQPTIITYFTPAAIALIIQHLSLTLASLSMVRAKLLGTLELWKTAPIRLGEIVTGNYLSYGLLTLFVSTILIVAVKWALSVPMLGPLTLLGVCVLLLIFASLGIGFAISLVARSEQSAAQMAMIILLASIFLGGFALPLDQLTPPVRAVSYLLPATYAGQLMQSIMIRGEQGDPVFYLALALIALLGLMLTIRLFNRLLRPI